MECRPEGMYSASIGVRPKVIETRMETKLRYIVSGKNPAGQRRTEFAYGTSCDLAVKPFRDQGWSELVLHTDEVQAVVMSTLPPQQGSAYNVLQNNRYTWTGYWLDVLSIYRRIWWMVLLLWALKIQSSVWPWWPTILISVLPILVPLLTRLIASYYTWNVIRATEHEVKGHWQAMLNAAQGIRPPMKIFLKHYLCATAYAGMKRLDDALVEMEQLKELKELPDWLCLHWLVSVYYTASEYERVKPLEQQLEDIAPDNVCVILTQGMRHLIYDQDYQAAGLKLNQAMNHEIADTMWSFRYLIEAGVALNGRRLDDAQRLLVKAEECIKPFLYASTTRILLAAIQAYQAIVLSRQGHHDQAVRLFRKAQPILEARHAERLLTLCKNELGNF